MLENVNSINELLAVAILVAGVVAARLASLGVGSLLRMIDRRTATLTANTESVVSQRMAGAFRALVFWLIVVLAVSIALRVAGIGGIATLLNSLIGFVPQLLIAVAIVVAGHLVGSVASRIVAELGDDVSTESLLPRLVHGTILMIAVVIGLQQVNVDISFVTQLILILVAIAGGGFMLAFALGARQHVANLLARDALSRLAVGDRVSVDGLEGNVVEIYNTGLDLATDEGVVSVPAARFAEVAVLRKTEFADDA